MLLKKINNILLFKSKFLKLLIGSTLTTLILFIEGFFNVSYSQNLHYSDPILISTDTNMTSTMAASALDKNGKLHIVFVGWYYKQGAPDNVASEIFYTNNLSGEFIEPVKLPTAVLSFPPYSFEYGFYSKEPSIAVDSHGKVHVAYYRTETQLNGTGTLYYTNNTNGNFSIPKILYSDSLVVNSTYYSYGYNIEMATGLDNDSIHVVFDGNIGTGHGGARYSVGLNGIFKVPITFTQKSGYPTIKLDNEGIPNIVYWINSDTTVIWSNVNLAISKIVDGRFSSPTILYESNSSFSYESAFAFDQNNNAHVVFRNTSGSVGSNQMCYIRGNAGQYTSATRLPTNTSVSLMYSIDIGKNQIKYIAYKQAASNQSLGFMYDNGSGFVDISPTNYNKYEFISAGPQWFTLDKINNKAYFVYTTGQIYMVTIDLNTLTSVEDQMDPQKSVGYNLDQNYPNPFNPNTKINFVLPKFSHVTLKVYNILGQEKATLINKELPAGYHGVSFDGSELSSGTYFYRIETNDFTQTKKMILMK